MKVLVVLFAAILLLAMPLASAQSWSGYLVDFKCYDAVQRSVNPFAVSPIVSRDRDEEIRECPPGSKTKSFALVGLDGVTEFNLDPSGNQLAVAFVQKLRKKSFLKVTLTGEKQVNTLDVNSIRPSANK